jgi:hypothetical protein
VKYLLLITLLSTCNLDEVIDAPKSPIGGLCYPGATYVCPCGDETWASDWKSGVQRCGPDFTVTACECEAGAGVDASVE